MTRRSQLIIAGFFLPMIFAPLVAGAFGYQPKEIENREIANFPPLRNMFSDEEFLDHLQRAANDRLPLRAEMVRVGTWLDAPLFDQSYNPTVSVGRDGWLFLRRDIYTETDPVRPMVDGIKRMGDALAAHGIQFVFTIAPNKSAIYPEKLDSLLFRANKEARKNRAKMQRLLGEQASAYFVDLWTYLLAAKTGAPRPLYLTLDTHWSPDGAAIASKAVVNRLHPGLWDDSALIVSPPKPMLGDLSHLQGLDQGEPVQFLKTYRPGVVVTETTLFKGELSRDSRTFRATSSGPYLIPGHTVILHDSFFERTADMLAPYFEEITFIHEHLCRRPEAFEIMGRSNTLIIALVERTVGGVGWFHDEDYQHKIEEAVEKNLALSR